MLIVSRKNKSKKIIKQTTKITKPKKRKKRKKKSAQPAKLLCGVCSRYVECKKRNPALTPYLEGCDEFTAAQYFYCDNSQTLERIHIDVCLKRQNTKYSKCKKCKLRKAVKLIKEIEEKHNGA